jgi:hypothetical protein
MAVAATTAGAITAVAASLDAGLLTPDAGRLAAGSGEATEEAAFTVEAATDKFRPD